MSMARAAAVAGLLLLVATVAASTNVSQHSAAQPVHASDHAEFSRAPAPPTSPLIPPHLPEENPHSSPLGKTGTRPSSHVVVHGPGQRRLPRKAFSGPLPRFVQRTVTERGGNEPSLTFGSKGALFWAGFTVGDYYPADVAAPLFRSTDGGMTWSENIPHLAGVPFNDQGGDPYLYRDATTGRLFYLLYFSGGSHIAWTDDEGMTWGQPLQVRVHDQGPTDYPKLWTSRPTQGSATPAGASFYVHLCYNAGLQLACERSADGGLTFQPSPSPYPDAIVDQRTKGCFGFLPGWAISSPEDGTIYMPKSHCGKFEVAISKDNGLTWERIVVADDLQDPQTPLGSEGRLAMDGGGSLYYFWIDGGGDSSGGRRAMLSTSRDGGKTWARPINVGAPGLTALKLPSIVAGDDGRIAISYVGSKVPGGWDASEKRMESARWDGYVSFSLDALSSRPVFATAMVNPADNPLRRGPCADRCSPDPSDCVYDCSIGSSATGMFDYLQLALDPTSGKVAVSLVDLCGGRCGTAEGTSRDPWSYIGAVGIQTGGPALLVKR